MVRDTFTGDRMARTMSHIMATFVLVPVLAPGLGLDRAVVRAVADAVLDPGRWRPSASAAGPAACPRRCRPNAAGRRRRGALRAAAAEVVRTPQTVGFAIALTCLFGIMSAYIASSELIVDEVFDRKEQFPIIFGVLALFLAAGSFTNARLVERVGLFRMIRGRRHRPRRRRRRDGDHRRWSSPASRRCCCSGCRSPCSCRSSPC